MPTVELSRVPAADGFTHVTVASGSTYQLSLLVPTDMLDQPGYHDMLAAHVAAHEAKIALRDREGTS